MLREETNRNKWSIGTVITIQMSSNCFLRRGKTDFGTDALKSIGILVLKQLSKRLSYFLKVRIKKILNNEIKLKMKYFEGRNVLMENFINGHVKFEWAKVLLRKIFENLVRS